MFRCNHEICFAIRLTLFLRGRGGQIDITSNMGFRGGGVKLTPPQRILVFKYPAARIGLKYIVSNRDRVKLSLKVESCKNVNLNKEWKSSKLKDLVYFV